VGRRHRLWSRRRPARGRLCRAHRQRCGQWPGRPPSANPARSGCPATSGSQLGAPVASSGGADTPRRRQRSARSAPPTSQHDLRDDEHAMARARVEGERREGDRSRARQTELIINGSRCAPRGPPALSAAETLGPRQFDSGRLAPADESLAPADPRERRLYREP
jgi:hypothetical protein